MFTILHMLLNKMLTYLENSEKIRIPTNKLQYIPKKTSGI